MLTVVHKCFKIDFSRYRISIKQNRYTLKLELNTKNDQYIYTNIVYYYRYIVNYPNRNLKSDVQIK